MNRTVATYTFACEVSAAVTCSFCLWGAKSRTIQVNSQQKVGLKVSLAFDKWEPLGGQGVAKVRALLSAYIRINISTDIHASLAPRSVAQR